MKKISLSILLFLFVYTIQAQTETIPITKWRKNFEGQISIFGLATDAAGNVYTTGGFNNTVDFDPGDGVFNLTSVEEGSRDIFICKHDASGNFVWAKQIGGDRNDLGVNLEIDSYGNIYVFGSYGSYSIDLDPGIDEHIITKGNNWEGTFVLKLNNNGDFTWVKNWSFGFGTNLSIDYDGNLYVIGNYRLTQNFDEGTDEHILTTIGNSDLCVLKMNTFGDVLWVKGFNSAYDKQVYPTYTKVQFDKENNVYLAAYITQDNTVDLDWGPNEFIVNTTSEINAFILKLTPEGDFIWANVSDFDGANIIEFKVDEAQNCYLFGSFNVSFSMDFEGVTQSLIQGEDSYDDIYLLKTNALGEVTWFKTLIDVGGIDYDIDKAGGIYIWGLYYHTTNFGLTETAENYTASDPVNGDQFVVSYKSDGTLNWFKTIDLGIVNNNSIKVDSTSGNVFIKGDTPWEHASIEKLALCTLPEVPIASDENVCIGDDIVLNASGEGTLGWYTNAIGGRYIGRGSDLTITILKDTIFYVQDSTCYASASRKAVSVYADNCSVTSTVKTAYLAGIKVYPNPTSSKLFIESVNIIEKILVTDLIGTILLETNAVNFIDISDLSNGIYYITILDGSTRRTQKIIKY